jgi:hypothetical protein
MLSAQRSSFVPIIFAGGATSRLRVSDRDGKHAEGPASDVECERDQYDPGISVDEVALPGHIDVSRGRLTGGDAFNKSEEWLDLVPLLACWTPGLRRARSRDGHERGDQRCVDDCYHLI